LKLKSTGFEILEDSSKKQIEKIKTLIIQKIAEEDLDDDFILSEFLVPDYTKITVLFPSFFSERKCDIGAIFHSSKN
jgi:hypothetical protein